jgi:hypothetical protein
VGTGANSGTISVTLAILLSIRRETQTETVVTKFVRNRSLETLYRRSESRVRRTYLHTPEYDIFSSFLSSPPSSIAFASLVLPYPAGSATAPPADPFPTYGTLSQA